MRPRPGIEWGSRGLHRGLFAQPATCAVPSFSADAPRPPPLQPRGSPRCSPTPGEKLSAGRLPGRGATRREFTRALRRADGRGPVVVPDPERLPPTFRRSTFVVEFIQQSRTCSQVNGRLSSGASSAAVRARYVAEDDPPRSASRIRLATVRSAVRATPMPAGGVAVMTRTMDTLRFRSRGASRPTADQALRLVESPMPSYLEQPSCSLRDRLPARMTLSCTPTTSLLPHRAGGPGRAWNYQRAGRRRRTAPRPGDLQHERGCRDSRPAVIRFLRDAQRDGDRIRPERRSCARFTYHHPHLRRPPPIAAQALSSRAPRRLAAHLLLRGLLGLRLPRGRASQCALAACPGASPVETLACR